jgi:hypothetical protein
LAPPFCAIPYKTVPEGDKVREPWGKEPKGGSSALKLIRFENWALQKVKSEELRTKSVISSVFIVNRIKGVTLY